MFRMAPGVALNHARAGIMRYKGECWHREREEKPQTTPRTIQARCAAATRQRLQNPCAARRGGRAKPPAPRRPRRETSRTVHQPTVHPEAGRARCPFRRRAEATTALSGALRVRECAAQAGSKQRNETRQRTRARGVIAAEARQRARQRAARVYRHEEHNVVVPSRWRALQARRVCG